MRARTMNVKREPTDEKKKKNKGKKEEKDIKEKWKKVKGSGRKRNLGDKRHSVDVGVRGTRPPVFLSLEP